MNELSCLLLPPFHYFIHPLALDIFIRLLLFLQTPLVYVFLGFILFVMELRLHKSMTFGFRYVHTCNQGMQCARPRASRRDLDHYLGNYHELYTYYSPGNQIQSTSCYILHQDSHPNAQNASTQLIWVVARNYMQAALITELCKAAVEFHPGRSTRRPIRRIEIRTSL